MLMNSPVGARSESHLSDEQIEAFLDDPMKIQDYETAHELMQILKHEIANIASQLTAAKVEAEYGHMTEERMGWVKRAAYAMSMKQSDYNTIMKRSYALTKAAKGELTAVKSAEAAAAKEIRLIKQAEAEAARASAEAERQKFLWEKEKTMQASIAAKHARHITSREEHKRFERHFIDAAKATLPPHLFQELMEVATNATQAESESA